MSRTRLPGPGIVGAPVPDDRCIAAAYHVRVCPHEHSEAYYAMAARGEELLKAAKPATEGQS